MDERLERQVIELIATDRIDIPISSMSGKLKRAKPKLAKAILIDGKYKGERVYARIETDETMKARGMAEAIELFEGKFPRHGEILRGMIAEKRTIREINLYFGINDGCRLTADDYMGVMTNLGFTEVTARNLYPELMDISRKMARKRDEERGVLIG